GVAFLLKLERGQPQGPTSGANLRGQPQGPTSGANLRGQPQGPTSGTNLRANLRACRRWGSVPPSDRVAPSVGEGCISAAAPDPSGRFPYTCGSPTTPILAQVSYIS